MIPIPRTLNSGSQRKPIQHRGAKRRVISTAKPISVNRGSSKKKPRKEKDNEESKATPQSPKDVKRQLDLYSSPRSNGNGLIKRNKALKRQLLFDGKPTTIGRQKFIDSLMRVFPGPPITVYNDVSDEDFPQASFTLVAHDIPIKGLKVPVDDVEGCNCPESGCIDPDTCQCSERHDEDEAEGASGPPSFRYSEDGLLLTTSPIIECGRKCKCSIRCGNRITQQNRTIELQIFYSEQKGWGVRCPHEIKAGTFITTYPGELITVAEGERREEAKRTEARRKQSEGKSTMSYMYDLDRFIDREAGEEAEYIVDAEYYGGFGRFFNHSCDPNMITEAVVEGHGSKKMRMMHKLAFFASRNIPPNEELCFNYDPAFDEFMDPEDCYVLEEFVITQKCYCGAPNCKGLIWLGR